jgi:hypothetical protein
MKKIQFYKVFNSVQSTFKHSGIMQLYKRYIYIMVHQRNIKGYIKGTSEGTSIIILFNNTSLIIQIIQYCTSFKKMMLPLLFFLNQNSKQHKHNGFCISSLGCEIIVPTPGG